MFLSVYPVIHARCAWAFSGQFMAIGYQSLDPEIINTLFFITRYFWTIIYPTQNNFWQSYIIPHHFPIHIITLSYFLSNYAHHHHLVSLSLWLLAAVSPSQSNLIELQSLHSRWCLILHCWELLIKFSSVNDTVFSPLLFYIVL